MNITYLIGNGFDINIGLPTSYESFLDYYCKKNDNNQIVKSFRNYINDNRKEWKDAELALGESTKMFDSYERPDEIFRECYQNIVEELANYLSNIQNNIPDSIYSEDSLIEFVNGLASFTSGLKLTDIDKINQIIKDIPNGFNYHVLNFNYTNVVDKLFSVYEKSDRFKIMGDRVLKGSSYPNALHSHIHVHGKTDGTMIFGVDSENQIGEPKLFCNDTLLKNMIIKSDMDSIIGDKTDEIAYKYFSNSDLIYVYGLSLGETDTLWWNRIIKLLKDNSFAIVIIYWYGLNNKRIREARIPYEKEMIIRNVKEKLFEYSSYDKDTNKNLKERVFISNIDIFEGFSKKVKGIMPIVFDVKDETLVISYNK